MLKRASIVSKTVQVAGSTLLSRLLGLIRETLMTRYIGANAFADVFFIALRLPNSLRKIFAEGALSAAFVPALVSTKKEDGKDAVAHLLWLALIAFESLVIVLTVLCIIYAPSIVTGLAPGFSEIQITYGAYYLRILMPFLFFISTSALYACVLHTYNSFIAPAIAPVLLNSFFIFGIVTALWLNLPITYLCICIVASGVAQLITHMYAYYTLKLPFWPERIRLRDFAKLIPVALAFVPTFMSMSVNEIALIIDGQFASYLKPGTISLLYYATRFVGIALGVFVVAFSTVLLPQFSHVRKYKPKRVAFYVHESIKAIITVIVPTVILLLFFSYDIFRTIFVSDRFSLMQAQEAGYILQMTALGLPFFALNKILLTIFYAYNASWMTSIIVLGATISNIILNIMLLWMQGAGLALATSLAAALQSITLLIMLSNYLKIQLSPIRLMNFLVRLTLLSMVLFIPLAAYVYAGLHYIPYNFLKETLAYWLWIGPACMLYFYSLWQTRTYIKCSLYFVDQL